MFEVTPKYSGHYLRANNPSTPLSALTDFNQLKAHDWISLNLKSSFLSNTLNKLEKLRWVDIENDYFEKLITIKTPLGFDWERVKKLNNEFEFIKNTLELYLSKIQQESTSPYSDNYVKIFCEPFIREEIVMANMLPSYVSQPRNIYILNFNYTNTLERYKSECSSSIPTDIIYIHGKLDTPQNPIIFGFGDEYNKSYLQFEDLRNKDLLRHIKSFGYLKTSNYHKLIRFIESEEFQVYVMGHSLGLSDRTMLKQIFEHHNCKSVKIFYYEIDKNLNDYTDKMFDIYSHFSDKGIMRKKIVPEEKSFPMPQIVTL